MTLTIQTIQHDAIYEEAQGTLAERIDYAWTIYTNVHDFDEDIKEKALKFLIYAFDVRDPNNINEQLIQLMDERDRYRTTNPEYIPNKSPQNLSFHSGITVPNKDNINDIQQDVINREILVVNAASKKEDEDLGTYFYTAQQRSKHHVHISKGLFQKDGTNFSTTNMQSHDKQGYAAFTLNANGELSLFIHRNMEDNMAHSSMNAGAPVVAAGEVKIEHGKLQAITTHSGHYQPTLFNVYRLLEYFNHHGVDISQAVVETWENPKDTLKQLQSTEFYSDANEDYLYRTPAKNIFKTIQTLVHESVQSIQKDIQSYQAKGIKNALFSVKDKMLGSHLTKDRKLLAEAFRNTINNFIQHLGTEDIKNKIGELQTIISAYEEMNKALSKQYNKKETSGRLHTTLSQFKKTIDEIKSDQYENNIRSKMKDIF